MKSFFRYVFATVVGIIIASLIISLLSLIFVGVFVSTLSDDDIEVKQKSILYLQLNKQIEDRVFIKPFEEMDFSGLSDHVLGLNELLENIEKAKTDDKIKGIYIEVGQLQAGLATTQELRRALLDFKESGKFIICYGENFSQKDYYLASVADSVFINPEGQIMLKGLSAGVLFFKKALEKLDIEAQVIRHGKYKSAVEPFVNDSISPENREQMEAIINTGWQTMITEIASSRKLSRDDLDAYAKNLTVRSPKTAKSKGLVDDLLYEDEVYSLLKTMSDLDDDQELRLVKFYDYNKTPKDYGDEGLPEDKLAVIYAAGSIQTGKGEGDVIGSTSLAKTIRKARKDSSIKAIVLRINSPGGSALASEVILREVMLAQQSKPFIVSMGDVAASGGYYIACAADTIVAQETTITGSIGVLAIIPNLKQLMNEDLGININMVKTHPMADLPNVFRALTEQEKAFMKEWIEETYSTFISHVAQGRSMTKAEVDSLGQGRVWVGAEAKQQGLVDVLGGLNIAVEIAAQKAGLERYRIVELPKEDDNPITQMLKEISREPEERIRASAFGKYYVYIDYLKALSQASGIQARMPFILTIE